VKGIGHRLLKRYLRSRVLPITTVMLLFFTWIWLAGLILWKAKVKEEFFVRGKLLSAQEDPSPGRIAKADRLVALVGWSENEAPELRPGESIHLSWKTEVRGNPERSFEARLVGLEREDSRTRWLLQPLDGIGEIEGSVERFRLVVRQRRLLLAALEKKGWIER